jgi:hypothetical protein
MGRYIWSVKATKKGKISKQGPLALFAQVAWQWEALPQPVDDPYHRVIRHKRKKKKKRIVYYYDDDDDDDDDVDDNNDEKRR